MPGRPGITTKRFSANKFQPIPDDMSHQYTMANPNDATIDIPLTTVPSRGTGARKNGAIASPDTYSNGQNGFDNAEKTTSQQQGAAASPPFRPGPGRRRKTAGGEQSLHEDDGGQGALNRMGRLYYAVLNFSVITRYFIYVSPMVLIIAIPIIIGATVAKGAHIGGVRIVWFFTWIEVIWVSLWVAKIFAHFLPFLFQFFAGFASASIKKYALIIRALEIPISLVLWLIVCLATFIPIMTENPSQRAAGDTAEKSWEATIKQILFALLICSLIFLGEKLIIQLISVTYHRKQYDLRIKESKHNVDLLGHLYDASRAMFPEYCREFIEEDEIISATIIGAKQKNNRVRDSVAPLRLIRNVGRNVGRVGDKVTAAFGNVASEITGKHFDAGSSHSIVTHALEKRHASEALAKRIWMSFVVEGRDALYEEDIVEVMGASREEEARECFHILDRDGNGDVSMEEMILTVAEFGRVRKSIARSMHDVDQAINVLDNLLLTVALIVMVLVFVSFVTTGAATVIAAGATSLLSLSFVFSVTAQEVLGSCVFLFVKHPFDVGDRVEINSTELFVEEISLLYTAFRTVAEQRITQAANNVLNTAWIDNVTRSKAMRERISLYVDFGTTFADIQLLKMEMEKFVRDKDNSRDFQPDIEIEVISVGNMDKLELRLEIRHKSNWSNETVRAARRSKFMCALVLAVRKVPINGPGGGGASLGDPSNPSYSVAITDEKAQQYRKEAAEKKESARFVPTSQMIEIQSTMSPTMGAKATGVDAVTTTNNNAALEQRNPAAIKKMTEADFVDALNSRPVGYDLARADESAQLYRVPSAANSGVSNDRLSVGGHDGDDQASLLRAPSMGRRKGGAANLSTSNLNSGNSRPSYEAISPIRQPSPLLMPPSVTGAGAVLPSSSTSSFHQQPSASTSTSTPTAGPDRYEIPSYYSAAISLSDQQQQGIGGPVNTSPYETNNPYGASYGSASTGIPPITTTAATPQYRSSPPRYQSPPTQHQPSGNAFAQQAQQQASSPQVEEDNEP